MFAVVVPVLMVMVVAPETFAETVPCSEGRANCSSAHSRSVIANNVYCCLDGFSMSWSGGVVNGISQSSCICSRQYYESDCVQGAGACVNATSRVSNGRCCLNGESMFAMSGVIINGNRVDSCKCRRYISYTTVNGIMREMTPEEKAQFDALMARLNERLNDKTERLNERLNDKTERLNERLNDQMERLNERLSDQMERLNERMNNQMERLNERMNNFNERMNQFSQNLNNRMNRLNNDVARMLDRRARRRSGS